MFEFSFKHNLMQFGTELFNLVIVQQKSFAKIFIHSWISMLIPKLVMLTSSVHAL